MTRSLLQNDPFADPFLHDTTRRRAPRPPRRPRDADREHRRLQRISMRRVSRRLGIPKFLAWCVLRAAFRRETGLESARAACISIRVQRAGDLRHFSEALSALLPFLVPATCRDPLVVHFDKQRWREREGGVWHRDADLLVDLACDRSWVIGIHHGSAAPDVFLRLAELELEVGMPQPRHIRAAAAVLANVKVGEEEAAELAKLPLTRLAFELRRGTSAARRRVRGLRSAVTSNAVPLRELAGMDDAVRWGLDLALDLAAWVAGEIGWRDVDAGVVLHGVPGTGKTLFASSLAAHCQVPLFSGSVMEWQSKGHLGDLLGAMYGLFEKAASARPCIVFLDEVDGFGDRSTFSHDNANYSIQVVNGLLDCLDGHGRREGVVVVAACNDVERLDPALRRPGRLDREIEVKLPDQMARERILAQKVGGAFRPEDLRAVAAATEGCSGAELERIARDARRRARRLGRSLALEDLLSTGDLADVDPGTLWRAAVHEAGHALIAAALGTGVVTAMKLSRSATARTSEIGTTEVEFLRKDVWTEARMLDEVAVNLAGMAAEITVFGQHGPGSGGVEGSDLWKATRLLLNMEASLGMGRGLAFLSEVRGRETHAALVGNPVMKAHLDSKLREQLARSSQIIGKRMSALLALARALQANGELSAAEIEGCLRAEGPAVTERTRVGGEPQ